MTVKALGKTAKQFSALCKSIDQKEACDYSPTCVWRPSDKKCIRGWGKNKVRAMHSAKKSAHKMATLAKGTSKPYVREIQDELPGFENFLLQVRNMVKNTWNLEAMSKSVTYQENIDDDSNLFTYKDVVSNPRIVHKSRNASDKFPTLRDQNFLNDIFTTFNVTEMLSTMEIRSRVIFLVVQSMNTLLEEVYSLDSRLNPDNLNIIFKGGVTLRLIIQDFVRNFVTKIENYLNRIIQGAIKISDFDFELVMSPSIPLHIYNKLHLAIYVMLGQIKTYMELHSSLFFNLLNYNQTYQTRKIKNLGLELEEKLKHADGYFYMGASIDAIRYRGNCEGDLKSTVTMKVPSEFFEEKEYIYLKGAPHKSACRSDFAVIANKDEFTDAENSHMALINGRDLMVRLGINKQYSDLFNTSRGNGSHLYCSHNSSLRLRKGTFNIHFQLNRMKYNYVVYMTLKNGLKIKVDAPGEIIDISSKFPDDDKKYTEADFFTQTPGLNFYSFHDSNLSFLSYSSIGHFKDTNYMIFNETSFKPWEENKYDKRIVRLVLITLLLYFNQPHLSQHKFNVVSHLLDTLSKLNGSNHCYYLHLEDTFLQQVYENIQRTNNENLGHPELRGFLKKVILIFRKILIGFSNQSSLTKNQTFALEDYSSMSLALNNRELYGSGLSQMAD